MRASHVLWRSAALVFRIASSFFFPRKASLVSWSSFDFSAFSPSFVTVTWESSVRFFAATSGGAQPFPAMNLAAGSPPPGTFDALRNHPQFAELARMVTQNPQMLGQILPVLEQTNPQVMQEIHNNPDQFMRLLQESASGAQQADAVTNMLAAAQAAGGVGGDGMPGMGMPGAPGGQTVVQLSREEADAIDRLQQLGFDRILAVEAYFACDKNEELAANYLFENMG